VRRAWRTALTGLGLWLAVGCGRQGAGEIQASGTIEATEVTVAAKVGGLLRRVLVAEGERVDSSAVVAELDQVDLDWVVRQAEAAMAVAQAQLDLAVHGPQAEDLEQARAAVEQAEVQVRATGLDRRRAEALAAEGAAPPKQLDDARSREELAVAGLSLARAGLAKLRAGTRPEQVAAARAQLAQTEAALGAARQRVADCALRAPLTGVVTRRLREPGEMVAQGLGVVTVTRLDPVRLKVFLPEEETGAIRLGQAVEVRLDNPDLPVRRGRVSHISPTAEFTPKNVQTREDRVRLVFGVEIELANGDGLLKPGLPGEAVFLSVDEMGPGDADRR
jgi:HlyD family secretion protein